VGQLLDHCMMSSSKNLFQEQELTGTYINYIFLH